MSPFDSMCVNDHIGQDLRFPNSVNIGQHEAVLNDTGSLSLIRSAGTKVNRTTLKGTQTMRTDLTDITMVIDRSGSMQSIRTDAEGGINSFIEQQKSVEPTMSQQKRCLACG